MSIKRFLIIAGIVVQGHFLNAQNAAKATLEPFEVATIKPHDPALLSASMKFGAGGEVTISGMTIRNLLLVIYDLRSYQVVGGDKWLDSDMYDIQAKVSPGTRLVPGPSLYAEQKLRLQMLFADRCHLKVRREPRVQTVYLLNIDKGGLKMQVADEASGSSAATRGTISPWPLVVMQLSQRLDRPLVDSTGLKGTYYLKLRYAGDDGKVAGIGIGRIDPSEPANSAPSLFTAVREQLGLRLDVGKAPVDTLIIESVTRPSAN